MKEPFIHPLATLIAGADKVGRWLLVTIAVILDPARPVAELADWKKLSEKRRESPYNGHNSLCAGLECGPRQSL